jgi:hypothetical protein
MITRLFAFQFFWILSKRVLNKEVRHVSYTVLSTVWFFAKTNYDFCILKPATLLTSDHSTGGSNVVSSGNTEITQSLL